MFDHKRSTRAESASAGDAACQAADDDIDIRCVDVEQLGQASAGAADDAVGPSVKCQRRSVRLEVETLTSHPE